MCQLGMKAAEMIEMYITNITDTIFVGRQKYGMSDRVVYFSRPYREIHSGGFDTLFMPVGRTDAQAAMRMSKSRSEYRSINNTVIRQTAFMQ